MTDLEPLTVVGKVKKACKIKKIPIYKLEKDLGFGNGYIGQLKKGTMPADRLRAVSEYLGEPMEFFLGETKTPAAKSDERSEKLRKINDLYLQWGKWLDLILRSGLPVS